MRILLLFIICSSLAIITACDKSVSSKDDDVPPLDLAIPNGFDYSTTRDMSLSITAAQLDANRTIAKIFNGDPLGNGRLLEQYVIQQGETKQVTLNLPNYANGLWIKSVLPNGIFSLHEIELNGPVTPINLVTILDDEGADLLDAEHFKTQNTTKAITAENPVVQDFESGDRNIEFAKCWLFQATVISSTNAISGNYSLRTGPMTSPVNPQVLTSPWVDLDGTGTLDFSHKLDDFRGTKELTVLLLDNSGNANDPVVLYYYDYANGIGVQDISIPITQTGIHRIAWVFRGTGGNARGHLDDVSIPGTYASDPVNNCEPTEPTTEPGEIINNYPASGVFGTLAFEDLWPDFGDYDMNDLVLDYNIVKISDSNNLITELQYTKVIRAIGAGLDSGFGVEFNIPPSRISSVSGQRLSTGLITTSGNRTEAGQNNAVVIFWDDSALNMGKFANTELDQPHIEEDTLAVTITFDPPVDRTQIGSAPWNPFIFVRGERGREIHLPNKPPTSLADPALLGTGDDDTNPAQGKFYLSPTNLNWAINLPESFVYPLERVNILDAYPNYKEWAESGGETKTDWFLDLPGNRVESKLYIRQE